MAFLEEKPKTQYAIVIRSEGTNSLNGLNRMDLNLIMCLVAQLSPTLCDPMNYTAHQAPVHGDSPGKNTGVGCYALLQGIFPTQGLNPGLPHCRRILYQLSHQGSPRILEWVAYPLSIPNPGIEPGSPALQAGSLPAELPGKPRFNHKIRTLKVGCM